MKKNRKAGLIFTILFLLVLTLPTAVAENIPLTEYEKEHLQDDTFGMLNNGVMEVVFHSYAFDDIIIGDTKIAFFNTLDEDLTVNVYVESYWEERREHRIRENYTYGSIPNLNWVFVPELITINSNSKYILPLTIEMPKKQAYEQNEDGGYICLITANAQSHELAPSQKLFITLFGDVDSIPVSEPFVIPFWVIIILIIGIAIGLIVFFFTRFEYVEIDEDGEELYYE